MATSNFPSSLDTTSALPASISDTANLNSPNHAEMHEVYNDAIIEIEEKVGIGDTTPTTGAILIGTGTGQSAWDTTPTFTGLVTANGGLTVTGAVTLTGAVLKVNSLWFLKEIVIILMRLRLRLKIQTIEMLFTSFLI